MVEKVSEDIIEKKLEGEFQICDTCGYELGFHVSFIKGEKGYNIILICPNCGQRFLIGWAVALGE